MIKMEFLKSYKAKKPASAQLCAAVAFFNFFNNNKWFYCIFYQINNLFLHQSYLKPKLTW